MKISDSNGHKFVNRPPFNPPIPKPTAEPIHKGKLFEGKPKKKKS